MNTYATYSDEQLLRLIAAGDQEAYKNLFHRFVPQLMPIIQKLTKTDAIADDIIQDTFYKIWLNRGQLVNINNARSYILKIIFNASFEYLRKQKMTQQIMRIVSINAIETPEGALSHNETLKLVTEAADNLPPQAKLIYVLSSEQGMKPAEIAIRLNLSIQTVRNTLARAIKGIRSHLNRHDISFPILFFLFFVNR